VNHYIHCNDPVYTTHLEPHIQEDEGKQRNDDSVLSEIDCDDANRADTNKRDSLTTPRKIRLSTIVESLAESES
jgi:hypothetical protein